MNVPTRISNKTSVLNLKLYVTLCNIFQDIYERSRLSFNYGIIHFIYIEVKYTKPGTFRNTFESKREELLYVDGKQTRNLKFMNFYCLQLLRNRYW